MNANVDDPEKEDVYSTKTYIGADSTNKLEHFSIHVTAENSPVGRKNVVRTVKQPIDTHGAVRRGSV
jgi:hypothetical protein